MTLKFKVDENLPCEVAQLLRDAGYDALTIIDQDLGGHADDEIARVCQQECRVIVTLDGDFGDIRNYPPADYSGIIVLNLELLDKRRVLSAMQRLLPVLESEVVGEKLWIVDDWRVRVRE